MSGALWQSKTRRFNKLKEARSFPMELVRFAELE
jgi:hypothetical protein